MSSTGKSKRGKGEEESIWTKMKTPNYTWEDKVRSRANGVDCAINFSTSRRMNFST